MDDYQAHETAIIDKGAIIGKNTKIWHWTHICKEASIGENCSFGQNVYVGNKVKIGNNVRIQNNVSVYDGVEIEDNVFCGPSMVFTNVYNPRALISTFSRAIFSINLYFCSLFKFTSESLLIASLTNSETKSPGLVL